MIEKSFLKKTFLASPSKMVFRLKPSYTFILFSLDAFSKESPLPEIKLNTLDSQLIILICFFSILFLLNAFIFIKEKEKRNLYLTFSTLSLFIFSIFKMGYGLKGFFASLEAPLSFALYLSGLYLWVPTHFNLKKDFPERRTFLKTLYLIPLISLPFAFILPSFFFWALLLIPGFIFFILFFILSLNDGKKKKILFLILMMPLIGGHFLSFLSEKPLSQQITDLNISFLIGTTLHFILMTFLLANDLIEIIREKTVKMKKLLNHHDDLSTQLMIEGINYSTAINQLSFILENMKQSFFIVDEGMIINNPISLFSQDLFHSKILGKTIYETVFQDIKKESEQYSIINFCWNTAFGSDETQWLMVNHQFPSKVTVKGKKADEKKTLKVSYYPIWNEQELLSNLMIVIDDITEVETLEQKMKKEKQTSSKRLTILNELTSNKRNSLKPFFSHLNEQLKQALKWSKIIKEHIKRQKSDLRDMETLFKFFHIIKGSSRQFGLTFISQKTHELETLLSNIYQKIKETDYPVESFYSECHTEIELMITETHHLVGIINNYIKVGNSLLNLEIPVDEETLLNLHENLKNFELFIFKLFQGQKFSLKNNEEIIEALKIKAKKVNKFQSSMKRLEKSLFTIQEYSKILNEEEIIKSSNKLIHNIQRFPITENDQDNIDEESIIHNFIEPIHAIKNEGLNLFCSSKPLQKNSFVLSSKDLWVDLILLTYYETKTLLKKDDLEKTLLTKNIANIKNLFKKNKFEYLTGIIKLIESLIAEGDLKQNFREIKYSLRKIWQFFGLIMRFDFDYSGWSNHKEEEFELEKFLEDEYHLEYGLFNIFLTKLNTNKKTAFADFEETMKDLLNLESDEFLEMFLPDKSFKEFYIELGKKLSERFNIPSINNFKNDFLSKKEFSIVKILTNTLQDEKFAWINYHKKIDILKLFTAFFHISPIKDSIKRPESLDILTRNFESSKKYLKSFLNDTGLLSKIDTAFERLLGIPIKFSLLKCHNLVEDISQTLGKKIQLKISGDEGSLEPMRFNQLQIALTHILRNSMDHGIELPSERIEKGKKELGTIEIICNENQEGNLTIIIKDDGQGINLKKIEEKALNNNIYSKEELNKLSKEEVIDIIFLPAFSTKETISEISGRGFGMDVVKTILEKIDADLKILTREDEGTTFTINLFQKKM